MQELSLDLDIDLQAVAAEIDAAHRPVLRRERQAHLVGVRADLEELRTDDARMLRRALVAFEALENRIIRHMHRLADEIRNERRARRLVDGDRRADLLDMAAVRDDDIIRDLDGLLLVVRDEDARDAEPVDRPPQPTPEFLAHLRVDGGKWLVEQQQLRLRRERPRERDALALPAGELHRIPRAEARQANELQQLIDARPALRLRHLLDPQAKSDVLTHRHVPEQRIILEDEADAALSRREVVHATAADEDIPPVRRLQPRDHTQNGRLAAARRAEQADEPAALRRKAHIA